MRNLPTWPDLPELDADTAGETGSPTDTGVVTPVETNVSTDSDYIDVAVGNYHSCGLHADGRVICWGDRAGVRAEPPEGVAFVSIDGGADHTCGVRSDGGVECWGADGYGELTVPDGLLATFISAGSAVNYALDVSGKMYFWGGVWEGDPTPDEEAQPGTWTYVSAGDSFSSCGIDSDGALSCWGLTPPEGQPTEGGWTQVTVGFQFTCALTADGEVACWGENSAPPPGDIFVSIDCGYVVSCGINRRGRVRCWGPEPTDNTSPADTFVSVEAREQVCAVADDGHVHCWGEDYYGTAFPP
jgi:alpha-tubulin suppressor-like RCC1 family protein